jgi:hypothetical protein
VLVRLPRAILESTGVTITLRTASIWDDHGPAFAERQRKKNNFLFFLAAYFELVDPGVVVSRRKRW